jgi:hypothetical protein
MSMVCCILVNDEISFRYFCTQLSFFNCIYFHMFFGLTNSWDLNFIKVQFFLAWNIIILNGSF